MIVHEKGKWVLKTKDGSRVLGTHDTKEEAEAQERAVEAHKHQGDSGPIYHIDEGLPVGKSYAVLENGWLRAEVTVTRTGVFKYRRADGTIERQLRLPEEVFAADAMKSLELVPLTAGHPGNGAIPLDANNTKQFAVGHIGENIRQVGRFVKAQALVTDAKEVQNVLSGKTAQLSVGYWAEHEQKAGVWQGDSYDVIQRNIRANHVAICSDARGGPDLRFTLDSGAEGVVSVMQLDSLDHDGDQTVTKFNIDGVDYEVSEPAGQALNKLTSKHAEELKAAKSETEAERAKTTTAQAHADSVSAELTQVKTALAAASDPATIRAVVTARVALEGKAKEVLGKDFKADASDLDLKVAVVEKLDGDKLTRKDAPYVDARFDGAVARASAFRSQGGTFVPRPELLADENAPDAEAARQRMIKEQEGIYKNTKGSK